METGLKTELIYNEVQKIGRKLMGRQLPHPTAEVENIVYYFQEGTLEANFKRVSPQDMLTYYYRQNLAYLRYCIPRLEAGPTEKYDALLSNYEHRLWSQIKELSPWTDGEEDDDPLEGLSDDGFDYLDSAIESAYEIAQVYLGNMTLGKFMLGEEKACDGDPRNSFQHLVYAEQYLGIQMRLCDLEQIVNYFETIRKAETYIYLNN